MKKILDAKSAKTQIVTKYPYIFWPQENVTIMRISSFQFSMMTLLLERYIHDQVGGPEPKPGLIMFYFKSIYKAITVILTRNFESDLH